MRLISCSAVQCRKAFPKDALLLLQTRLLCLRGLLEGFHSYLLKVSVVFSNALFCGKGHSLPLTLMLSCGEKDTANSPGEPEGLAIILGWCSVSELWSCTVLGLRRVLLYPHGTRLGNAGFRGGPLTGAP